MDFFVTLPIGAYYIDLDPNEVPELDGEGVTLANIYQTLVATNIQTTDSNGGIRVRYKCTILLQKDRQYSPCRIRRGTAAGAQNGQLHYTHPDPITYDGDAEHWDADEN